MIPNAKKNLHASAYHLNMLKNSKHFEEVEINFAAFVNAARNTTFVLQKEFKSDVRFIGWYGDEPKSETKCVSCKRQMPVPYNPPAGTKQHEMKNDKLCKFFGDLRNQIVKEGINNLHCSTEITSLDTTTDFPDQPANSGLLIGTKGVYFLVNEGTPKEDAVPAMSKTAQISTRIYIADAPNEHLGKKISDPNLFSISQHYYEYLQRLVEEWTGILNSANQQ